MTRTITWLCLLCIGALSISACDSDSDKASFARQLDGALVVEPAVARINTGTTLAFRALIINDDGGTTDVSDEVSWSSSDDAVASVDSSGLATGLSTGQVVISARLNNVDAQADARLDVVNRTVAAISVTPFEALSLVGLRTEFQAIAVYEDGSQQNITRDAQWSASDTRVATVDQGVATAIDTGVSAIVAAFDGSQGSATLAVTTAAVARLEVDPGQSSIPVGLQDQFNGRLILEDDTVIDVTEQASWRVSDPAVASVSNEDDARVLATGLQSGSTDVIASIEFAGDAWSGEATLNVTDAVVTGLQVEPTSASVPVGTNGSLTATAYYSNGESRDVTRQAGWLSDDDSIVAVSNSDPTNGDAVALAVGEASVSAGFDGLSAESQITVTDAVITELEISPVDASLPAGTEIFYKAIALYSDNTREDVSAVAAWQSTDTDVIVIASGDGDPLLGGLARALHPGQATISARYNAASATVGVTVTDAAVSELVITPADGSFPVGTAGQFVGTAWFTDGSTKTVTTESSWESEDSGVVDIVASGEAAGSAVAVAVGDTVISIHYQGVSASTGTTVTAATLTRIQVDPANGSLPRGLSLPYTATGIYSDLSKLDLTRRASWRSSAPEIASINADGIAFGLELGAVRITASSGGITGETGLEVTDALLQRIEVEPQQASIDTLTTQRYLATAILSSGDTLDISQLVTWLSSDPDIAVISNIGGASKGLAFGRTVGEVTISAFLDNSLEHCQPIDERCKDSAELEVTAPVLNEIIVSTSKPIIHIGNQSQYYAHGIYANGLSQDLTDDVDWRSGDPAIATVSTAAGSRGLTTGVSAGIADIEASLDGASGAHPLQVLDAALVSIEVAPADLTLPVGDQQPYTATAHYSDGSAEDISEEAVWQSSDEQVATVSAIGLLRAQAEGNSIVSASTEGIAGRVTGTAAVTVTAAEIDISLEISPAAATIADGTSQQFVATVTIDGDSSDVSAEVIWASSAPHVATVSNAQEANPGLASAVGSGNTEISAEFTYEANGQRYRATADLQVLGIAKKPDFVVVEPPNHAMAENETEQYRLIGHWNLGNGLVHTQDLGREPQTVWQSSNKAAANISNGKKDKGIARAVSAGTTVIRGAFRAVNDSTDLTVQ